VQREPLLEIVEMHRAMTTAHDVRVATRRLRDHEAEVSRNWQPGFDTTTGTSHVLQRFDKSLLRRCAYVRVARID